MSALHDVSHRESAVVRREGPVLAWLAVVVGGLRVGLALVLETSFGAEATLGLAILVAGIVGVVCSLLDRP